MGVVGIRGCYSGVKRRLNVPKRLTGMRLLAAKPNAGVDKKGAAGNWARLPYNAAAGSEFLHSLWDESVEMS